MFTNYKNGKVACGEFSHDDLLDYHLNRHQLSYCVIISYFASSSLS